jgi:hypothetical protein
MALMAASLLFATQCYATVKLNTSRSNIYRAGSTTSGGGAGVAKSTNYRMGGGGGGKGAMRRDTEPPRGGGPGIVQKGRR